MTLFLKSGYFFENHGILLVEQAKRVQGLKEYNKKLLIQKQREHIELDELHKQNKRYRELLDRVLELQLYINYSEAELYEEVLKIMNDYLDLEGGSE